MRSPLEQLQQKHEKIETLKEELSDIRLKYEELFRRCKRAEDKAKH